MTAYACRALGATIAYDNSAYKLIDIDVIGNGFIPGLGGIYGNTYLQALKTDAGSTTLAIYSPDGKLLIGFVPLNDFLYLSLTPQGVQWLADQGINVDQVGGTPLSSTQIPVTLYVSGALVNNTNPLAAQDIEQAGYVAPSSPPSVTNAGADTSYTFTSQVSRVIVQNNTSANLNIAFDAVASAGSLLVTPGTMLIYPKKCTVLHLFTASAQTLNGTSAANIVVLGAL